MKENKLVLGTAQLGFNYGIANTIGKPTEENALEIMKYAAENGIYYFDTSYDYGDSEIRIGRFLSCCEENYCNKINIITKLPSLRGKEINGEIIKYFFFKSLHRLNQKLLYCYMVHDFNDINNNCDIVSKTFLKLKEEGYIKKIGVSVYDESQIKFLLRNFDFDLIQVPISIFDQRLFKDNSLLELKKKSVDIYARSIFLQGLIFFNQSNLPMGLKKVKKYIKRLNDISFKFKLSKEEIALFFANSINEINKIVLGVDNVPQLKKNVEIINKRKNFHKIKTVINFQDFNIDDTNIIDPRRWKMNNF